MSVNNFDIKGLTDEEVLQSRTNFGRNALKFKKENGVVDALKSLAKEPMITLLILASLIYFLSGQIDDGLFLLSAIFIISAISLYQDSKSRNALQKLKDFTQPSATVVRNGQTLKIKSEDLIMGDCLIVEEGTSIPADALIIHSNDFSVNESILTGESFAVFKDKTLEDNSVYKGTTVASGLAVAKVTGIGNETKLGKIGKSLDNIEVEKTPLEVQINRFVKKLIVAGIIVFLIVWALNYSNSYNFLDSLLKALTLAMSILPEEIPMALAAFMAIGALRLMHLGVLVKQMKTVETLGSATVICTDKTGTITENKMSLAKVFSLKSLRISTPEAADVSEKELLEIAMWASEPIPFDSMEVALHEAYTKYTNVDERINFKMIHEYPLSGKPPMMTHIFENNVGKRIIAAKGAPEAFLNISNLSLEEKTKINEAIKTITSEGYRVLGVAKSTFTENEFPANQQEFEFNFMGIVAFYDPPKENIKKVIKQFYEAGIKVKIITGDNAETTTAIAKQIDFKGYQHSLSGDELMQLSDLELQKKVKEINIFSRMFPDAKLRIINALKTNDEIVAMTGDGVNDGPALKAAHIGVAMGKKGTEIAKQAASLILIDDDFSKMVDAIAMGRRIYTNLKKAIQYIISIHIPIILMVFVPLALGWIYPNILSPVHIIFLELIMGPTCSIVFENEPMEKNTMQNNPRSFNTSFLNRKELTTSIIQGLIITVGALFSYQYAIYQDLSQEKTRTIVFIVLITSNIILTLVNRSFYYSIFSTLKYKNNLIPLMIGITITITTLLLFVPVLTEFFDFATLSINQLLWSILIGFTSVIWYEFVKLYKRKKSNSK